MKKTSKNFAFIILTILFFFFAPKSFALDSYHFPHEKLISNNEHILIEDLISFFREPANFRLIDDKGNEITTRFLNDNRVYFVIDDWTKILEYYYSNVSIMQQWTSNAKMDLALTETKSETKTFYGNLGSVLKARITIRGTIWYNRNTYVVSNVSDTTLVNIINIKPPDNPIENIWPQNLVLNSYKSGLYNGYFSCSFRLIGEHSSWLQEDFGNFNMSMYITPN